MLQLFDLQCSGVVGKPTGNQSFSVDDWNYVVIVKAKGNVFVQTSGAQRSVPIGPLSQALGITTGKMVGRGVVQVESDQAETITIAFSGDGSRVTGFATGGSGATFTNPMNVQGEFANLAVGRPNPVVIGMESPGGQVVQGNTDDAKGLDVLQYGTWGQNEITGTGSLSFLINASAIALVEFDVVKADTGGPITPSIAGISNALTLQPQVLDQNRVQVLSGAPKYASAGLPTINAVDDRVVFLVPADCLSEIVATVTGVNNDGIVHIYIAASPLGGK